MPTISAQDLYTESYLEVAQTQRSLVEVQLSGTDSWKKLFVQRLATTPQGLTIHTTRGETYQLGQIGQLRFSLDESEVTAISCACK